MSAPSLPILLLLGLSTPAWSSSYWIAKTGNDQNDCLTEPNACASIQKALSLVQPGDHILIKPGIYSEDSSQSPYSRPCYFFNGLASLCVQTSGTQDAPIRVSAAPAAPPGSVVLDNLNARVGILMNAKSYYHFDGLTVRNSIKNGIANQSQAGNEVADPQFLSVGVRIENCQFFGVSTPDAGDNIAAIGMWSSQDWLVRNTLIDGVNGGSGIRVYGVINARVEHNQIRNVSEGVLWKDHFVNDLSTRELPFESEIAYNLISASRYGVLIQIRGANTPEAGHNWIHHNIFNGFSADEAAGVRVRMYEAFAQSGELKVAHNLFDCAGLSGCQGVSVDASSRLELANNLFVQTDLPIDLIKQDEIRLPQLWQSDHNLYIDGFKVVVNHYAPTVRSYLNLADWQAVVAGSLPGLNLSQPDLHSQLLDWTPALFDHSNYPYAYSLATMT